MFKIYVKNNYFFIKDATALYEGLRKDVRVNIDSEDLDNPKIWFSNVKDWNDAKKIRLSQIVDENDAPFADIDAFIDFYTENTGNFNGGGAAPIFVEVEELPTEDINPQQIYILPDGSWNVWNGTTWVSNGSGISNLHIEYFDFSTSQLFTLSNDIDAVIGVNVQGQGALNEDQFRIILPNQIEIIDELEANDYIVIQYTSGLLQLANVYTKTEVDNLDLKNWGFLKDHWTFEPEMLSSDEVGEIWSYKYKGVERFRFIPIPYDARLDAFYADITLEELIVKRG
jgi:hypothetical protein